MDRNHNRDVLFADNEDRYALLRLVERYRRRFYFRLYHNTPAAGQAHEVLLGSFSDQRASDAGSAWHRLSHPFGYPTSGRSEEV